MWTCTLSRPDAWLRRTAPPALQEVRCGDLWMCRTRNFTRRLPVTAPPRAATPTSTDCRNLPECQAARSYSLRVTGLSTAAVSPARMCGRTRTPRAPARPTQLLPAASRRSGHGPDPAMEHSALIGTWWHRRCVTDRDDDSRNHDDEHPRRGIHPRP